MAIIKNKLNNLGIELSNPKRFNDSSVSADLDLRPQTHLLYDFVLQDIRGLIVEFPDFDLADGTMETPERHYGSSA